MLYFITSGKFISMFEYQYIIKDNAIVDSVAFDSSFVSQVYEVIRVVDGVPVFFDAHFRRFISSCSFGGVEMNLSKDVFATLLNLLTLKNGVRNCNIRYSVNIYSDKQVFYAGFVHSNYPLPQMYEEGVVLDFLNAERFNPNAKILNRTLRERADALMSLKSLYEVALVNQANQITEGSKSNLFFIDSFEVVHTAPLDLVLGGITRQIIIEEIVKNGIPFVEEPVLVENIGDMVAGFVSGTSPSVLPIALLGNRSFLVKHPLIAKIAKCYSQRVAEDIASFRDNYYSI